MLGPTVLVISMLWGRLQQRRDDDRGMTTETMIITAMLAVAAIGAVTLIARAITDKGTEIQNEIDGAVGRL